MKIFVVAFATVVLYTLLGKFNAKESGDVDTEIDDSFLETWEAPEGIKKNFPYYLAGYDKEGRPVWIFELGKWDFQKIVDQGLLKMLELETYYDQLCFRIKKSLNKNDDRTKANKKARGWVLIDDLENFRSNQLLSLSTLSYLNRLAAIFEVATRKMDYGFFINMNSFAEKLTNFLRPILGPMLGRSEIHGTSKAKWRRAILKRIPKYSLPKKYGGYANFTPIEI